MRNVSTQLDTDCYIGIGRVYKVKIGILSSCFIILFLVVTAMTSINDSALVIIICLLFFLILSLLTNGVFFSFSLYKNIRAKPKGKSTKKDITRTNVDSNYVQMGSVPEDETISPYYIKMASTTAPPASALTPPGPVDTGPYANLSDLPK